ncbi:DUF4115 domain-containing protein [Salinithrix halophila]|uniref:DUF4115 domain-containing protein n=1 Tax=Salinithrix halophila TaxID=1485204 RepID=A0ABV8JIQ6_9BACL
MTGEAQASAPEGMALLNRDEESGKSEYEVKNNQNLLLQVKANQESWLQIRENENGGYLRDVTLTKGERFRFRHPESVTTDLWISLGVPEGVELTINGQAIKPTKTIQIHKKE